MFSFFKKKPAGAATAHDGSAHTSTAADTLASLGIDPTLLDDNEPVDDAALQDPQLLPAELTRLLKKSELDGIDAVVAARRATTTTTTTTRRTTTVASAQGTVTKVTRQTTTTTANGATPAADGGAELDLDKIHRECLEDVDDKDIELTEEDMPELEAELNALVGTDDLDEELARLESEVDL
ncbi:hypothetical protein RI367_005617 [Sorochytrium milnesiophthora]